MNVKVLLVEDNDANRYLATFLLESGGFHVVHAANGIEALARARAELPDVILMDIHMPEMDGYEAARLIREEPGLAQTPLIAVTSYAMVGDRDKAMKIGFVGYIEKPISTETFVAQIRQFLPPPPESP